MSGTADPFEATTGVGRNYRLTAPDRRAFAPSELEQALTLAITRRDTPADALGYMLGARAGSEESQSDYMTALNRSNMQTAQLAARQNTADQLSAQYRLTGQALANPQQAALFGLSRQLFVDQPALERGAELSDANLATEQATAIQRGGAGAVDFARAGVLPPMGTQYRLGVPTQLPVQGTPQLFDPNSGRGGGGGDATPTQMLSGLRLFQDQVRRQFGEVVPTLDASGRVIGYRTTAGVPVNLAGVAANVSRALRGALSPEDLMSGFGGTPAVTPANPTGAAQPATPQVPFGSAARPTPPAPAVRPTVRPAAEDVFRQAGVPPANVERLATEARQMRARLNATSQGITRDGSAMVFMNAQGQEVGRLQLR